MAVNNLVNPFESSSPFRCQRSRACYCCEGKLVRERVPSPKKGDPDYSVAICPKCDGPALNQR